MFDLAFDKVCCSCYFSNNETSARRAASVEWNVESISNRRFVLLIFRMERREVSKVASVPLSLLRHT
jgi:hypothetical protein